MCESSLAKATDDKVSIENRVPVYRGELDERLEEEEMRVFALN